MAASPMSEGNEVLPLSKNKLKKLKRDQEWEENRAKRKAKRKEKVQEKKQRRRIAREEANQNVLAQHQTSQLDRKENTNEESGKQSKHQQYVQLPITFVLDCGFDYLMMDKERKSLGSQITRCYSDNHRAPYQAHLVVSSFGGHLKERFDGLLAGQYHSWRGVRFLEEDFVEAAMQAKQRMKGHSEAKLTGIFADKVASQQTPIGQSEEGEVVYLTSDSPETLTELRPYSTYIIGGLVDRNRHKGVCYKKARDRGIKTAKLPIGDYMQMTSRFVLATNHVAEIMLRWLELGDWGKAFLQVVPKRKGGTLKNCSREEHDGGADGEGDEQMSEEANAGPSERDGNTVPDQGSDLISSGTTGGDGIGVADRNDNVGEFGSSRHEIL